MQKAHPVTGHDVDYGDEYEHENYEQKNLHPHVHASEYYVALSHVAFVFFMFHVNHIFPLSPFANHPPLKTFAAMSMIKTIITTIANMGSP
jgi:hypothetical protein